MRARIEPRVFYVGLGRIKKPKHKAFLKALTEYPAYLARLMEERRFVASGDWQTHDGVLTVFRAESLADAKRLEKSNPLNDAAFAEYEVHEWPAQWDLSNLVGGGFSRRRRR